jgi:RNA polymerase sigma-70 factor (ECF subfamily)
LARIVDGDIVTVAYAPSLRLHGSNSIAVVTMPSRTLDDSLELVSVGDRAAFSDLYDEVAPMVYGLALRITKAPAFAEEVSQEVFVQIWQQAGRFDRSKGSAKSWIATLAHRRAVDAVRRNQSAMDRDAASPVDSPAPDVAEQAVIADEHDRVKTALRGLSDIQREAITLAYYGGFTYREVAERLDSPVGTVKTRIRDGLHQLRSQLEDRDV